jgi:6-phosphofructokinase 1
VAQTVTNYLNDVGLPVRGQVTGQVPGVLQRCTSIFASTVDLDEAYEVSRKAVDVAMNDGTGWMATILREAGDGYRARYDKVPLDAVANSVRHLPASWITSDGLDVTDDFIRYAQPLIGTEWPPIELEGGRQRFARFKRVFIEKKLPEYVPEWHRERVD